MATSQAEHVIKGEPSRGLVFRCDPRDCSCVVGKDGLKTCHQRIMEFMSIIGMQQPTIVISQPALFHFRNVDPAIVRSQLGFDRDFDIDAVFEVIHPFHKAQYENRKELIAALNEGNPNEQVMFHVSRTDPITLCNKGLDVRRAHVGFFGRGIYLTNSLYKANHYSPAKGNPHALRIMFQCRSVLGRSKVFEVGHFARDLVDNPEGFQSVKGFIHRDYEYVIYNNDQVVIERVIFYRYLNTDKEKTSSYNLPSDTKGYVVFLTTEMSLYFNNISSNYGAEGSPEQTAIKRLITAVLKQFIGVDTFFEELCKITKEKVSADFIANFKKDLADCFARTAQIATTSKSSMDPGVSFPTAPASAAAGQTPASAAAGQTPASAAAGQTPASAAAGHPPRQF